MGRIILPLKKISVTPLTHTINRQRGAIDSFPPAGQVRTRSLDIPTRDNGELPKVTGPGVEPPERSLDKGGSLWSLCAPHINRYLGLGRLDGPEYLIR